MSWEQGNNAYGQSPHGQGSSIRTRHNGNSYQNNYQHPDGDHACRNSAPSGGNYLNQGNGRRQMQPPRQPDPAPIRYACRDHVQHGQVQRPSRGHQDANSHDQAQRPRIRPIEIPRRQPDQTEEDYRHMLTARVGAIEQTRQEIKDQIHSTLQRAPETRHEPNRDWIHRAKTKISYLTRERYLIRRVLFGFDGGNQNRQMEATGPSLVELFMKISRERLEPELFEEILNDARAEVEMAAEKTQVAPQDDTHADKIGEGAGGPARYDANDDFDLIDDEADSKFNR